MSTLSMPLYFYDEHGYKIGPINKKELYALAQKGVINPDTRITDGKIEVTAKCIPKLTFLTPEAKHAEELKKLEEKFNPENINFDSVQTEQHFTTSTPLVIENTHPKAETRLYQMNPINQFVTSLIPKKSSNPPTQTTEPKNYPYFQSALNVFYTIAALIWYVGITLTIIGTMIAFTHPAFVPLILIGGLIVTFTWSYTFGLIADFIQWLLNTESHMHEIKNHINHSNE